MAPKWPKELQLQLFCNKCKRLCHQKEQKRGERYFINRVLYLSLEETLLKEISLESEEGVKKLVSVLATSMLVIRMREKVVETIETGKIIETVKTTKANKMANGAKMSNRRTLHKFRVSDTPSSFEKSPCWRSLT